MVVICGRKQQIVAKFALKGQIVAMFVHQAQDLGTFALKLGLARELLF